MTIIHASDRIFSNHSIIQDSLSRTELPDLILNIFNPFIEITIPNITKIGYSFITLSGLNFFQQTVISISEGTINNFTVQSPKEISFDFFSNNPGRKFISLYNGTSPNSFPMDMGFLCVVTSFPNDINNLVFWYNVKNKVFFDNTQSNTFISETKYNYISINKIPTLFLDNSKYILNSTSAINNDTFAQKYMCMLIKTGSDITSRQVIYGQGDSDSGIVFYLDNGNIYLSLWTHKKGFDSAWFSTPINIDSLYLLEINFNSNVIEAYVNNIFIGSLFLSNDTLSKHKNGSIGDSNNKIFFHDIRSKSSFPCLGLHLCELIQYNKYLNLTERHYLVEYFYIKWDLNF